MCAGVSVVVCLYVCGLLSVGVCAGSGIVGALMRFRLPSLMDVYVSCSAVVHEAINPISACREYNSRIYIHPHVAA